MMFVLKFNALRNCGRLRNSVRTIFQNDANSNKVIFSRTCCSSTDSVVAITHKTCAGDQIKTIPPSYSQNNASLVKLLNINAGKLRTVDIKYYSTSKNQPEGKSESSGELSSDVSTNTKTSENEEVKDDTASNQIESESEKQTGIFQRFKNAYKEYGKVLVAVHVATSCVWFGSFYYAASCGLDVVPILDKIGASETIIKPFKSSGVGHVAVAYLLYKLATPARYTVTIGGTQVVVRYLRKRGFMEAPSKQDSLRQLYKDSREQIKEKSDIIREKTTTQLKETSKKIRKKDS